MSNRRPADWRFPTDKQQRAEETARRMSAAAAPEPPSPAPAGEPADPMPDAYWDAVLNDPKATARPDVAIQNRRLSEIPQPLLRVACRKCDRIVEIETTGAQRLYGQHAIWKDVGIHMLKANCTSRNGSRDDDGCWQDFGS